MDAELLGVCLVESLDIFSAEIVFEIDTTGKSADESVDKIQNILKQKASFSGSRIDWLTYPESIEVLKNQ